MQSDAITELQSVPQSLAEILAERKDRTRLGLSRYTAEAAEHAAESNGDLRLTRSVKGLADVHSILWPAEQNKGSIVNLAVLIGDKRPTRIKRAEGVTE